MRSVWLFWHSFVTFFIFVWLLPWKPLSYFMPLDTICVHVVATFVRGAGLLSAPLVSDSLFCMSLKPAVFLCRIDFHCTLPVSPCCHSGVWCVALVTVLNAPVTAAALLLSRPAAGNSVFDVKQLDGSHSASGLDFTAAHWPGQQPCQRNTAERKISYLCLKDSMYTGASTPAFTTL